MIYVVTIAILTYILLNIFAILVIIGSGKCKTEEEIAKDDEIQMKCLKSQN